MAEIKTIVFDLGGVLVDWNPKYVYRTIFDTEEKVDWFVTNICSLAWNEEQDGGRLIAEANKILIAEYPEYEKEILAYYDRWEEMLNGSNEGVVEILRSLRDNPKYRIYALTNWSAETFPKAIEQFDFLKWFEGIIVSGKEHLKKPDPAIYDLLVRRYQINVESAIFIDDNQRNVDASNKFGLPAIRFDSDKKLRKDLTELGVEL